MLAIREIALPLIRGRSRADGTKPPSFSILMGVLWILSLGLGELDRYVIGFNETASLGATYGVLATLSFVPVVLASGVGLRAIDATPTGRRVAMGLGVAGAVWQLAGAVLAYNLLPDWLFWLFIAQAVRAILHVSVSVWFFEILRRQPSIAVGINVGVGLINTAGAAAYIFSNNIIILIAAKLISATAFVYAIRNSARRYNPRPDHAQL
jgi:hypothetical protein